eukprot:4419498-Lingulodinium_polyedra.AAC.1
MPRRVTPRHALLCQTTPCHGTQCFAAFCRAVPCFSAPCHAAPRRVAFQATQTCLEDVVPPSCPLR